MSVSWTDALFYLAFASQIFLLSMYLPRKMTRQLRHMVKTYPEARYPKLYPRPAEHCLASAILFDHANRAIAVLGVLVLGAMLLLVDHSEFADDGFISEAWPAAYGMVQLVPFALLELSAYGQFRLMRRLNQAGVRKAELKPRRIFELVSPRLFAIAVAAMIAAIAVNVGLARSGTAQSVGLANVGMLVAINAFFGALAAWLLRARNPNPHQSARDRRRQTSASLHSYCYVSIVISLFFAASAADERFGLDYLDALLMSAYFQLIGMLSTGYMLHAMRLDDLDLDVYKAVNLQA